MAVQSPLLAEELVDSPLGISRHSRQENRHSAKLAYKLGND